MMVSEIYVRISKRQIKNLLMKMVLMTLTSLINLNLKSKSMMILMTLRKKRRLLSLPPML